MRRAALLPVVVVLASAGCDDDGGSAQSSSPADTGAATVAEPGPAGVTEYTLEGDGRTRAYRVCQPTGTEGPLALVIGLHGGFGEGESLDALTQFTALADEHSFLVAYPDGVDGNWNDGRAGVPSTAHQENIDDVGFLAALIDDVGARYPVDPARVYMAGLSNGAMMTNRFACERAEVVAAIALVVGTAPIDAPDTCEPAEPVAVIAFHGTADPLVPYDGGFVRVPGAPGRRGEVISVDALAALWGGPRWL